MTPAPGGTPDPRTIFVVHGRNEAARQAMFAFLRSLGLHPLEWEEVVRLTGESSPYIGTVLEHGFRVAHTILILITGDDLAMLRPVYQHSEESGTHPQARQNVVFEAGMAFGRQPERTILVTLGPSRLFSDISGRHAVVMDNTPAARDVLRQRLLTAGCTLTPGVDWLKTGDFDDALTTNSVGGATELPPAVTWSRHDAPAPDVVLGNAQHSMLLLGVSHFRVVTDDQNDYWKWLEAQEHRVFGMLFLNPFSPHVFSRRRRPARSNDADVIVALDRAVQLRKRHPRFFPVVYDGPYRFSAVGRDLGTNDPASSKVSIFSSSYTEGITRGFRITLSPGANPKCFSFYEHDLLSVWRAALANQAGHGVSIVARWRDAPEDTSLNATAKRLLAGAGNGVSTAVFARDQLHVTLTSLRRTQRPPQYPSLNRYHPSFAPPLSVSSTNECNALPAHFPAFVAEVVKILGQQGITKLEFPLTKARLTTEGHIVLASTQEDERLSRFFVQVRTLAARFAADYPNESRFWKHKDYQPKYERFLAHATIGVAFRQSPTTLPMLYDGPEITLDLPEPYLLRTDVVSVVHYAYRSLLRCVGEFEVHLTGRFDPAPETVLSQLGLADWDQTAGLTVFRSIAWHT